MSAVLATVLLNVSEDHANAAIPIRGFCDTGSQVNLISESCVQRMRLYKHRVDLPIVSVAGESNIKFKVNLTIFNHISTSFQLPITAYVVPNIPGTFPDKAIEPLDIDSKVLADPTYYQPGGVELLLGASVWVAIVLPDIIRFVKHPLQIAQQTRFGYVVLGQGNDIRNKPKSFHVCANEDAAKLDSIMLKFWNADEIPKERIWTIEEQQAEDHFIKTHCRDRNGRFVVTIPRKIDCPDLAVSYNLAKACFLSIEKKFSKFPGLKEKYIEVMNDYIDAGHMVEVGPAHASDSCVYYMPHHPINYDQNKSKGKFRVVFNGSAPSSNGVSFNQQQLVGPKLQDDLIKIFLRFRLWEFGLTADIKQMFRQVRVAPVEYNFQRILWRKEPHLPLKHYAITVVSWGMTSAGFNSVRSLRQCAIDGADKYPTGSQMALNDFYFDDMLSGAHSESELNKKQREVSDLLMTAGFELSKWRSNAKNVDESIHVDNCEMPLECGILGMKWEFNSDCLHVNTANFTGISGKITKRAVVSAIAQVYDPSGLVLPIIVTGKIMQQSLWKRGVNWDDELPLDLQEEWFKYEKNILNLKNIKVPRWVGYKPSADAVELHIFSDASELAIGACAYLVIHAHGRSSSHLLTARSRVAQVKRVTIPRLELSSAVLAVQLEKYIRSTLNIDSLKSYYWSDSMITLYWIRKNPLALTPFVANRVTIIQENSSQEQWRHAPGHSNPADLLTRGAECKDIENSNLWWHGPKWVTDIRKWPETIEVDNQLDPEKPNDQQMKQKTARKAKVVALVVKSKTPTIMIPTDQGQNSISLLDKYSELETLLRVTAYVFRFIKAIKNRRKNNARSDNNISITAEQRQGALRFWVRHTQQMHYGPELANILKGKPVDKNSAIARLTPWVDDDGLIRATGRLKNSQLSVDQKFQLLIPPQARLAQLIVEYTHITTLHGGTQLVMAEIRKWCWINRLRQITRSTVTKCVKCIRFIQKSPEQLMGHLPMERVTVAEPFARTGVDFAGPFLVKRTAGRPTRNNVQVEEKAWIAIFICLVSRAVHIEVLFGLSVHEFLAAFERFVIRKGQCFQLISDNGTTFVGADNELAKILQEWSLNFPLFKLAPFNTDWKFITPAAPHKGGIWEAAVKSFKHHLRRIIGSQPMCGKTLQQAAIQIEGCLNSRPLWPESDDPNDLKAITPADIVLGKPIRSQPLSRFVADCPDNRLSWWQARQKLHQRIWQQWQDDYLATLQVRNKWFRITTNLDVNHMVIIREDNLPPTSWCLGRVVQTYPDKDGLIRSAKIRTATGTLDRPITKLCILLKPDEIKKTVRNAGGGDADQECINSE